MGVVKNCAQNPICYNSAMRYFYVLSVSVVLFGLCGAYFFYAVPAKESNDAGAQTHSFPPDTSYFERGQYYFNVQGEADGPYDLERARYYYQKALQAGEEEPTLWYQLGRIDFVEGDYISTIDRFETQIELYGDTVPNVYYGLGLVYGFKGSGSKIEADLRAGAENFEKFLTYEPDSPWARTDLSWILFELKEFEAMIPVLETGLETHPDHPWLLNMYGLALMNSGQREKAATVFERSLAGAQQLTVEEWGRAYPGNHPQGWEAGLNQFVTSIEKNREINNARLAERDDSKEE